MPAPARPSAEPEVEAAGAPRVPTPRDYLRAWRALDRRTRLRITWEVLRGRAMADAEEAALAVANARRRRAEGVPLLSRVACAIFLGLGAWQLLAAPFAARGGVVWAALGTVNVALGLALLRVPALIDRAERLNLAVVERRAEPLGQDDGGAGA
jgi:hypothetical protein